MKVRVKLGGRARAVDVGDIEQCTLAQLQQRTADALELGDSPFSLSLNKKDTLSGDDLPLSQLGIVPGDLIFVLCPSNHNNSVQSPTTSSTPSPSPSTSSTCASRDAGTPAREEEVAGGGYGMCGEDRNDDEPTPPSNFSDLEDVGAGLSVSSSGEEENLAATAGVSDEDRDAASPCPLEDPEVNRCLQEPMLCRESSSTSVPAMLRDLFDGASCRSMMDAAWVAVHTLLLEVGFRPLGQADEFSLRTGWNGQGFYKQEYRHLSVSAEHSCSLIGVPMGQILIVHGVTNADPPLKTDPQSLKVSDFVQNVGVGQDVCGVYKNLDRLSRTVKDLICQRLMSQLSEVCGFPVAVGLLSLSYEIKLKVLSYLSAVTLCRMGQVCRDLTLTYKDPCLWRRLYLREFGQNGDNSLNKNWYQLYKEAYQQRKERRRLSRQRSHLLMNVPPWLAPPPGHFPPLVPPVYPGGIIGGDYDLNPEFGSSIPHPLGGQPRGSNPFLPLGPHVPGGPFLPRPRFNDPFGPGAGPGPPFMGLRGSTSRNHRASPFSSLGGHRFF